MKKKLLKILEPREQHWVGDGFHVSTLFSVGMEDYKNITPFLMLDHARPKHFPATDRKLGVGEHPHRGFETVTFAIKGEVAHRDSGGGGGTIKTGGVQWMTAASGVVHEEFHSEQFAKSGGDFEMVQLWVNLPAKDKMTTPRYQSMEETDMPTASLANGKAKAKVVAGKIGESSGPAKTFTPINIYQIDAQDNCALKLPFEEGTNTLVLQLKGSSSYGDTKTNEGSIALFERQGREVEIEMDKDSRILVLNGQPIDEPVASYGPFVMNTKQEIIQAIEDFQAGKMGRLVQEG